MFGNENSFVSWLSHTTYDARCFSVIKGPKERELTMKNSVKAQRKPVPTRSLLLWAHQSMSLVKMFCALTSTIEKYFEVGLVLSSLVKEIVS